MLDAYEPLLSLVKKYADLQRGDYATDVWSDMENLISKLSKLEASGNALAGVLHADAKKRWRDEKEESSFFFWKGVRHFSPNGMKMLVMSQTQMSYEELCVSLPDFTSETVTKASWEQYVDASKISGRSVSARQFWMNWKSKDPKLSALALDLISVPPAATQSDSLLSIAERVLHSGRSASAPETRQSLLFHTSNQDVCREFPHSKVLRHGFLNNQHDDDDDDDELVNASAHVVTRGITSYDSSMAYLRTRFSNAKSDA